MTPMLPTTLVGLSVGPLLDRWPRKPILIGADVLRIFGTPVPGSLRLRSALVWLARVFFVVARFRKIGIRALQHGVLVTMTQLTGHVFVCSLAGGVLLDRPFG